MLKSSIPVAEVNPPQDPVGERRKSPLSAVLAGYAAASLAIGFYYLGPYLFDDYTIANDVRQAIHWFQYRWPHAFAANDPLIQYAAFSETPVVNCLYRAGSHLLQPILLGKLLTLIVFAATCAMLGWMVCQRSNPVGGLIAIFLVAFAPPRIDQFYGLFSHSFFPLLILAAVHWAERERVTHCAVLMAVSGLFYPPAFVLLCVYFGIAWLVGPAERRRSWAIGYLCALLIGIALLWAKYIRSPDFIGHLISPTAMRDSPALGVAGRYPFYPNTSLFSEIMGQIGTPYYLFLVLLFVSALPRWRSNMSRLYWCMVGSVVVTYIIASRFVPYLYLPDRYVQYSLPYLAACFLGVWGGKACAQRESAGARLAFLLMVLGLGVSFHREDISPGVNLNHYDNTELYRALAATPEGCLIAAPPFLADEIPVYVHRSVLFNYELSHPWYPKYYSMISQRTDDFYRAYYSTSPAQVEEFLRRYHIDYLVVSPKHFSEDYQSRKIWYFEPWNRRIRAYMHRERPFWWQRPDRELPLFYKSSTYMIFGRSNTS